MDYQIIEWIELSMKTKENTLIKSIRSYFKNEAIFFVKRYILHNHMIVPKNFEIK